MTMYDKDGHQILTFEGTEQVEHLALQLTTNDWNNESSV